MTIDELDDAERAAVLETMRIALALIDNDEA